MNIIFTRFAKSAVIFPFHVRQRTLQRFKLYLTSKERSNVEAFLRLDFNKATVNFSKHMSPFYTNMMDSKHGKNSFVASSEYLNYYGNYDDTINALVIKTVFVKKRDVKS